MKIIPLNDGHIALVDDEDYRRVCIIEWSASPINYGPAHPSISATHVTAEGRCIPMDRFILNAWSSPDNRIDVLHVNGFGQDNRKENLRIVPSRSSR